MPLYMYQLAYTPESIAAQIKDPQDRLKAAAEPLLKAAGAKLITGGYSFGEYDLTVLYEADDDTTAAAIALAVGGGGAVRSAKTTKLLSGADWIGALKKAQATAGSYKPVK